MSTATDTSDRPRPTPPRGATIRAHLRHRQLEHLVERISTGRNRCLVRIRYTGGTDLQMCESAKRVAVALRELWHDGEQRVQAMYGALVTIDRAGWWRTMPNTPAGLEALAARERFRNALLLAAIEQGRTVATRAGRSVRYRPTDRDPRRPWVDSDNRRHSPFDVVLG